jgi:hypothetical protein
MTTTPAARVCPSTKTSKAPAGGVQAVAPWPGVPGRPLFVLRLSPRAYSRKGQEDR